jgi:hypothetical protein
MSKEGSATLFMQTSHVVGLLHLPCTLKSFWMIGSIIIACQTPHDVNNDKAIPKQKSRKTTDTLSLWPSNYNLITSTLAEDNKPAAENSFEMRIEVRTALLKK